MRSLKPHYFVTTGLALVLLAGCASAPPAAPKAAKAPSKPAPPTTAPAVPADSEIVLDNGRVVTAATPEGKITISAGPGMMRTISWDGAKRYVVMKPHTVRVNGSKGIYFDGRPQGWQAHNGLSRVKMEEGQLDFDNVDDASIWMQIRRLHYVNTSDGLVVGWKRLTGEATLQVEVWQFTIAGEKPSYLPNAKDYLIQTRQAPVPISARTQ